jgi:hypothetical protein
VVALNGFGTEAIEKWLSRTGIDGVPGLGFASFIRGDPDVAPPSPWLPPYGLCPRWDVLYIRIAFDVRLLRLAWLEWTVRWLNHLQPCAA